MRGRRSRSSVWSPIAGFRLKRWWALCALLLLGAVLPSAAGAAGPRDRYAQVNLVSDLPGVARLTDANLINPWGLSQGPTSPVWSANQGTSTSTLYPGGVGASPILASPFVVAIPGGPPTGTVFNSSATGFSISGGGVTATARFLFATLGGAIVAWAPEIPPGRTQAHVVATTPGAAYTGLTQSGDRLYAADFAGGKIDVFDDQFKPVADPGFTDPSLPAGYKPFNVQKLFGQLYVAYALSNPATGRDVPGVGNGFVDVYTAKGRFVRRLTSQGMLNSPWGLVVAPSHFGRFSGDVLVGNFGDGRIHAYDPRSGSFQGELLAADGAPIVIEHLWALRFGNGVTGTTRELLFTAGIGNEEHGLLGKLIAMAP
jgi:uncharacterized protein (TIGR03118 family)